MIASFATKVLFIDRKAKKKEEGDRDRRVKGRRMTMTTAVSMVSVVSPSKANIYPVILFTVCMNVLQLRNNCVVYYSITMSYSNAMLAITHSTVVLRCFISVHKFCILLEWHSSCFGLLAFIKRTQVKSTLILLID